MPTGHFLRTDEHKKNISIALKNKPKPWLEKEKTAFNCPCGNIFQLTPGRIRKDHGKYCSRPCYYQFRTPNSYGWKIWNNYLNPSIEGKADSLKGGGLGE